MTREMFVIAAVAFLFDAAGHRQLRLNRPAPVTATTVNIAGVLGRWPCAQRSIEPEKSIGASVKRESPNKQHCNNQQQSADDGHTAVWSEGGEMIVWGGLASPTYFNTGGR